MDHKKRLDKVLQEAEKRVQEEVGALLGADFTLIGEECRFLSKEDIFSELRGKQICAMMDIVGDIEGNGCLLIGIKDAIRLGGTLIMLPDSELEEVCGREDYTEEVADSFGEIANIVAGSLTKEFEDSYPKSCRFIRKEQEIIVPTKVDISSEKPIVDQIYYVFTGAMTLEGRTLGNLLVLMPPANFGLETPADMQEGAGLVQDQGKQDIPDASPENGGKTAPAENIATPSAADESPLDQPAVSAPDKPAKSKFNVEKHKKKVDALLEECRDKVAKEVAALLSADIMVDHVENAIVSKEDFFAEKVTGKQVETRMEVVGDVEGNSHLFVSLRDAIHLGGILIMLPPSELDSVMQEEDFGEDAKDAYGEVANIISGVYTSVFEEQYIKKLRFIRKELQQVIPVKVEAEGDEPIRNQHYYCSTMNWVIEGQQHGTFHMLFPLDMLQLSELIQEPQPEQSEQLSVFPGQQPEGQDQGQPVAATDVPQSVSGTSRQDAEKEQARIDKMLISCRERMQDEVGALLGMEVTLSDPSNSLLSKEEFFFDSVSGKQVLAHLDVVGELEGKSYLSLNLADAIRIGGVLIMLPASELDSAVSDGDFGADTQDAFGEVSNIISGVYTAIFEEQYTKQIRFVKTGLSQVSPLKVDIESEEPIANEKYYVSSMTLGLNKVSYGEINFLLPATLFGLEGLDLPETSATEQAAQTNRALNDGIAGQSGSPPQTPGPSGGSGALDILLISDDVAEAAKISQVLQGMGYSSKTLSFKENALNYLPGQLKAVFLVMKEVNEQAFGVAIKINAACSLPLIAAGPGWTRTKVIKAVRYGVRDIILTPATADDIQEKANHYVLQMAA